MPDMPNGRDDRQNNDDNHDESQNNATEARHTHDHEQDTHNQATMPQHAIHEPPRNQDDTDELDFDPDEDVPFKLPKLAPTDSNPTIDQRRNEHRMVTMPVFKEPGVPDPKETLLGSGGLDPNPDMVRFQQQNAQQTPQSNNPTIRNMPPVQGGQHTVPSQAQRGVQRQPMPQQAQQQPMPQGGGYMPPPPQGQGSRPLPKRRRRRQILGVHPGCFYAVIGLMLTFCGGLTLLTVGAAAFFIPQLEEQWSAEIARVDDYEAFQSTFYYDRNGQLLYEAFDEGRRTTVPYERFPENLVQATIAIEDDSFWTNIGIDVGATTVAFLQYVGADANEDTAGGSTITQQLVRNVLFDFEKRAERSVQRKVEEIILAILLTNRRSKEDILAFYLNEIYYGNLAYGAQSASQTFFGKDVEDLTLGEAALLAGLPQAPSWLDPLNPDPEVQNAVYDRQRQVLQEMVEEGYITDAERDQALRQGLSFNPPSTSFRAPHFTVYAQNELERLMGELGYSPEDIANGGYQVFTTVDLTVNTMALGAARTQVANLASNNVSNAAVVVLKPLTGEIMAMVGSIDYDSQTIDGRVNVTTALRQPGSTMKPFTYAGAIERGMSTGDVIWDTRTEIGIPGQPLYVPRNYDSRFHGPMTMRSALANSYNIPAVQTVRRIGVDYLLEIMRRFGVETLNQDASQYGLSLTLGGGEVSLLELTNAYGVFANQGAYVAPTSILCVVNRDGEVIYQYENGCPMAAGRITTNTIDRTGFGRQALDPRVAFVITDMLSDNIARTPAMGSNSPLYTPSIQSAVKTGTTNDVKDNWTVGYTRNVAIGVWVGNNNGDPMVRSSGLTGAAPIWNSVMSSIYADSGVLNQFTVGGQLLPDKPNPPAGLALREICDVRRLSDPSPSCPATINEWFLESPAGIPDAQGNLQYPPAIQASNNSDTIREVSPSVYQAAVFALPPEVGAGIQFNVGAGEKQPLPPKYCIVQPAQRPNAVGAQELLFVELPNTSQADLVEAERYARDINIATLPIIDCWDGVFTIQSFGNGVTTAIITQPYNGQQVTGNIPIIGTADFDPSQIDYYHLYIQGGQFSEWTPLGNPGRTPIVNGQLETLQAEGLPSGSYILGLGLVRDGEGLINVPYQVTFTVP
jgi:penicillin-binding protein 1C